MKNTLRKLCVLEVFHAGSHFGPPLAIRNHLVKKAKCCLIVELPLVPSKRDLSVKVELVAKGRSLLNFSTPRLRIGNLTSNMSFKVVIYEVISVLSLTVLLVRVIRKRIRFNIAIGVDPISVLICLFLKFLGSTNLCIYAFYSDLMLKRFDNLFLDAVYKALIKLEIRTVDYVWVAGPKMKAFLMYMYGLQSEKIIQVPNCAYIPVDRGIHYAGYRLVSAKSLVESSGIQLAIKALRKLVDRGRKVQLYIVGEGPYEGELRKLVDTLGLKDYVFFLGKRSHHEVMEIYKNCDVGLSTYVPYKLSPDRKWSNSYAEFIDCTISTREYLAFGLPVIATEGMTISGEIKNAGAGFSIPYSEDKLIEAIESLLDPNTYQQMSANALKLGNMSWEDVLDNAFKQIMLRIHGNL
jgi:glycosyltransferase involved in cell wall biosynthesis